MRYNITFERSDGCAHQQGRECNVCFKAAVHKVIGDKKWHSAPPRDYDGLAWFTMYFPPEKEQP